jgi:antitoxin (DNA-binding transcriptional repressor) of toxin-antitoxin stability system
MKMIEIDEASLADYGRKKRQEETWVLTRHGKPVAAVVPLRRGMDAETFSLSHDPEFIEVINRSWVNYKTKGGVSSQEMRRRLGLSKPARKSRRKTR